MEGMMGIMAIPETKYVYSQRTEQSDVPGSSCQIVPWEGVQVLYVWTYNGLSEWVTF